MEALQMQPSDSSSYLVAWPSYFDHISFLTSLVVCAPILGGCRSVAWAFVITLAEILASNSQLLLFVCYSLPFLSASHLCSAGSCIFASSPVIIATGFGLWIDSAYLPILRLIISFTVLHVDLFTITLIVLSTITRLVIPAEDSSLVKAGPPKV